MVCQDSWLLCRVCSINSLFFFFFCYREIPRLQLPMMGKSHYLQCFIYLIWILGKLPRWRVLKKLKIIKTIKKIEGSKVEIYNSKNVVENKIFRNISCYYLYMQTFLVLFWYAFPLPLLTLLFRGENFPLAWSWKY